MDQRILWRRGIAVLIALMGLANIASPLLIRVEAHEYAVYALFPLEIVQGSRHLSVLAGLALLAMGRGLWGGKRWTWTLTLLALCGSAVFHLMKGLDWDEAAAALLLVALLIWQRNAFRARPDPPTIGRALGATLISLLILLCYAVIGGFFLRRFFHPHATTPLVLQELGARLLMGTGPLHPGSRHTLWFLESFSVMGSAMALYLIGAFLHSFVAPAAAPSERRQARTLIKQYGSSSLSYFALLPDKSLFFGQSATGVVAYRVAAEVAVVCGDLIVAPEEQAQLIEDFLDYCMEQSWEVCLYETQERNVALYETFGLHTLKIGEDAWIDLHQFTLKGKQIADIRHAVSKVEREGLTFHQLEPTGISTPQPYDETTISSSASSQSPTPQLLWDQMHALVAQTDRGKLEMQFSIGKLPPIPDPEARYTVVLEKDGLTIAGFCSWLPIYAVNGWALDVMQRSQTAPNGTMEYAIAQALLHFQQIGADWASLGVAPLADAAISVDEDRSLIQRGVRFLYEHPRINELYRYKSLFFFKRKFAPSWRSVYLIYSSHLALPWVLYALLRVHLPEIGPAVMTDFLRSQSERNLQRWTEWLHTRGTTRGGEEAATKLQSCQTISSPNESVTMPPDDGN